MSGITPVDWLYTGLLSALAITVVVELRMLKFRVGQFTKISGILHDRLEAIEARLSGLERGNDV
jgi:hypothetical protein